MKATFTKTQHTGDIASNRKENGGFAQEYAVLVPRKLPSGQAMGHRKFHIHNAHA